MRLPVSARISRALSALLALACAATLLAQDPAAEQARAAKTTSLPTTREAAIQPSNPLYNLQSERNLVVVRVVVFDKSGHAVKDLKKDDFRLYDDGKLQNIQQFEPVAPGSGSPVGAAGSSNLASAPQAGPNPTPAVPSRFLGLYFDDVDMDVSETLRMQAAARKFLADAAAPGDRIGLFTSSGQGDVDFTQDRTALDAAIAHLAPRPLDPPDANACPRIYPYQSYQIVDLRDAVATEEAVQEALVCRYNDDAQYLPQAAVDAQSEALRVDNTWQQSSEDVLRGIGNLVRRMSILPGQRTIVLVSPGFLTITKEFQTDQLVDRSLRSNVTISTLDSRGLPVESPFAGINERTVIIPGGSALMGRKAESRLDEFRRNAEILQYLAEDTGGHYFHNNNDLLEGLHITSSLAPAYYVLAFSPHSLKKDGRFHRLKVELAESHDFIVEARRGYFAPRQTANAAEQAEDEIRQAIFSQNQVLQLPIDVHTQFFMMDQHNARLAILTHLDLRPVPFQRHEGLNLEKLTFVTALFDRNGQYVTGKETHIDFHLLDASLEKLQSSGLTVKDSFDVKPGTYLIRQVVQDARGGQISGVNQTIEIPN